MRCGLTDEIEIDQQRGSALVQSFPRSGKLSAMEKMFMVVTRVTRGLPPSDAFTIAPPRVPLHPPPGGNFHPHQTLLCRLDIPQMGGAFELI